MSLQWTLVATFLYIEIGFMIILLLPFISPTRWSKIFKSRLITGLASYANLYFNVMLVALVLLLLDAIREISIYKTRLNSSNDPQHGSLHYGPTMELVKEFRAQRNFYIAGTALFLWFVTKRLLSLISHQAQLIAENEAVKKQAESASRAASALLNASAPTPEEAGDKKERRKSEAGNSNKELAELERQILLKNEELEQAKKSLNSAKLDLDTMKKQSKAVTDEYDNLLKEHAKVLARLEKLETGEGGDGKKHN